MRSGWILVPVMLGLAGPAVVRAQNTVDPFQPYDVDGVTAGLYHLDEGTGGSAIDATPYGLTGSIHGATWSIESRFGAGVSLSDSSYIALPVSSLFSHSDATFEAWIRMTRFEPDPAVIVVDCHGGALGGGRQLGIDATGRAYALAGAQGQAGAYVATASSVVPLDHWIHLAAIFDETNARIQIAVNGTVEGEAYLGPGTNLSYPVNLGRHRAFDNGHFLGVIDEVRISQSARRLAPSGGPDGVFLPLALAGGGPGPRVGHTLVTDLANNRAVLFGGRDGAGQDLDDTWVLPLEVGGTWQRLETGSGPSGRHDHSAIYDPRRRRMIVFAGAAGDGGGSTPLQDLWSLDLGAPAPVWSRLTSAGSTPPARSGHAAVFDPSGDRMVVCGGALAGSPEFDVWSFSLRDGAWSRVQASGTGPTPREGHSAVLDPVRRRVIVFGGRADGQPSDELWIMSADWTWSEGSDVGGPPSRRAGHSAVYDPVRDRMLVHGGSDPGALGDCWALRLTGDTAWSWLSPVGGPPLPRHDHAAAWDPARDRMVLFGGAPGDAAALEDAWELRPRDVPHPYRLFLAGGSLNGQVIDREQNTIVVAPGRSIAGTVRLRSENDNCGGAIVPVEYTPTWGDHATSWKSALDQAPCGGSTAVLPIALSAPTRAGTYAVVFGSLGQLRGGFIASMTAWPCGSNVWNDGNDLADLEEWQLAPALANGWAALPGWECDHFEAWPTGLTFVRVVVREDIAAPLVGSPPTIDGRIDSDEWFSRSARQITLVDRDGATADAILYVQHDGTTLYVALASTATGNTWDEYCALLLDGDHSETANGSAEAPHVDVAYLKAGPGGWSGYNRYAVLPRWMDATLPSGAWSAAAGRPAVYEFAVPLSDLTVQTGGKLGLSLSIGTDGTAEHSFGYPYWSPLDVSPTWTAVTIEEPGGAGPVDRDDFEDGDAAGWDTWTASGTTDHVVGTGFTLEAAGGVHARDGNFGLRARRTAPWYVDLLELGTRSWTGPVRFSFDIRPFIVNATWTHSLVVWLSEGSGRVSETGSSNFGVQFTADGQVMARSSDYDFLGMYTPNEWCHVVIDADPATDLFSIEVTGPGVPSPIRRFHLPFEENLDAINFVEILCDQPGPNEFALDNVLLEVGPPALPGAVHFDLHEMYGLGMLCQPVSRVRPTSFSYRFDGVVTSDHSMAGILRQGESEVLRCYVEGGALSEFNRAIVYFHDQAMIEVHDRVAAAGTMRVDLTESEIVAYLDGAEIGRAGIPPGADLTCDECCVFAAVSNHIDARMSVENVTLRADTVEVLENGDFQDGCAGWRFADISVPYQGSSPWCTSSCEEEACAATIDLVDATLNGRLLDPIRPVLQVSPGEAIEGEVVIDVRNRFDAGAVVPVVYTPSWGDHEDAYQTLSSWTPVGVSRYVVPISLTAPMEPDTHCITFAAYGETSPAHVASLSAWNIGPPRWNDGNDLGDMRPEDMLGAWSEGCALLQRDRGWQGVTATTYGLAYLRVEVRPSLAWTTAADSSRVLPAGEAFPVVMRASGREPDSVVLHYSAGADCRFRSIGMGRALRMQDTVLYVATIPPEGVGPFGVRFFATAHRGSAVESFHTSIDPMCIRVRLDDLAFPGSTPAGAYRMISLPMGVSGGGFVDAFGDDLGSADPRRWRAFRYSSLDSAYAEIRAPADAVFEEGRACWLITKDATELDSAPLGGISTRGDRAHSLLLAPGWNMIADPFAFPISWDSVSAEVPRSRDAASGGSLRVAANGAEPLVVEPPYWWDPERRGYADSVDVLRPFEGYWVFNRSGEHAALSFLPTPISALEGPGGRSGLAGHERWRSGVRGEPAGSEDEWNISITASADGMVDGANRAGLRAGASFELDPWDRREPPGPPGPSLSLAFPHADWSPGAGAYAVDIRSGRGPAARMPATPASRGERWFFDVVESSPDSLAARAVDLEFSGLEEVPRGTEVALLDRLLGTWVDLRQSPRHACVIRAGRMPEREPECRFLLVAGEAAFVQQSVTEYLSLESPTFLSVIGPNPFRAVALLRYGLASTTTVALEVYNVLGARVRTLASDVQSAGRHEILWDGRDERGRRVPAGVYFVHLRAAGERLTRRIVLAR